MFYEVLELLKIAKLAFRLNLIIRQIPNSDTSDKFLSINATKRIKNIISS